MFVALFAGWRVLGKVVQCIVPPLPVSCHEEQPVGTWVKAELRFGLFDQDPLPDDSALVKADNAIMELICGEITIRVLPLPSGSKPEIGLRDRRQQIPWKAR